MSLVTPREPETAPRPDGVDRDPAIVADQASLATRWSRLDLAVASVRGESHSVNEDSHSRLDRPSPLYVVADGVGGGAMASWASRELVLRVHAALDRRRVDAGAIRDALLDADCELGRGIAQLAASSGAATVALCAGTGASVARWLIAWVGDCRVYRVRAAPDGPAELLTRDDTYDHLGETPPPGGSPHDPARMVGNGAVAAPNVGGVDLGDGEMLVLCSDGLHRHVEPLEIARLLRSGTPLARGCVRLLELARSRDSNDDATLLVVRRRPSPHRRLAWVAGAGLLALLAMALTVPWSWAPQQMPAAPSDPGHESLPLPVSGSTAPLRPEPR
jgi:protein phosphatase